jgi:hypothetical protein
MIDTSMILIGLSTTVVIIATIVYIISIVSGKAKPHRTTRIVILIIVTLSAASLWTGGDRVAFWLAFSYFVESTALFAFSLKYGMGGWSKSDIISFGIAIAGISLWQVTATPLIGLISSIVADFAGTFPTILKTYRQPNTEDWRFWMLDVVASALSLSAVTIFTFQGVVYPVYLIFADGLVAILSLRRNIPVRF